MSINDAYIKELIENLDQSVSSEGAAVRLDQYGGGPDESQIIGNRVGYLRLGIELLKAAYAEPIVIEEKNPHEESKLDDIDVNIDYIITPDSVINFDWFQRTEEIKPPNEYKATVKDRLIQYAIFGGLIAIILFAIKGCFSFVAGLF